MDSTVMYPSTNHISLSLKETQERVLNRTSQRQSGNIGKRSECLRRGSELRNKHASKAVHIAKEIIEKDTMYKGIDKCHGDQRARMMLALNAQVIELQRRRGEAEPRGFIESGAYETDMDLSSLFSTSSWDTKGSPHSGGSVSMPSNECLPSPASSNPTSPPSCVCGMEGSNALYNDVLLATAVTAAAGTSTQIPAYVTQQTVVSTERPQVALSCTSPQSQQLNTLSSPCDMVGVEASRKPVTEQAHMPIETATLFPIPDHGKLFSISEHHEEIKYDMVTVDLDLDFKEFSLLSQGVGDSSPPHLDASDLLSMDELNSLGDFTVPPALFEYEDHSM